MSPTIIGTQFIGVIWIFGWVILFIIINHLRWKRKFKRLELLHRERLVAMEKGLPLPELPEFDNGGAGSQRWWGDREGRRKLPKRIWLAIGVLSIMTGGGTVTALLIHPDPEQHQNWPFGLIPIFVGIGFVLQHLILKPSATDRETE